MVNGLSLSLSERHGFRLSPTSCHPDRIRGLCDRSCRRCSKSCHRPRCSCGRYGPSCCNYSSSASQSGRNRCRPPGSCAPCDQSCCNCNNSTPVPVGRNIIIINCRKKHRQLIWLLCRSAMRYANSDREDPSIGGTTTPEYRCRQLEVATARVATTY